MRPRKNPSAGNGLGLAPVALALWLGASAGVAAAAEVRVAVAANFAATLRRLAPRFERATADRLRVPSGSSGKLYAQIRNGAPFDVFLSADIDHPRRLEQQGLAVPGTRFTYAIGRLALWSPESGVVDAQGAVLRTGGFEKLAIANPRLAPYGAAAVATLHHLGVWARVAPRLVYGENIAQTFQFVSTGNATLGFVALAQIASRPDRGSYWPVPDDLHAPLDQQAVLLARAAGDGGARAFLAFLASPETRAVIAEQGYATP